jgi:hypothetical protein
LHRPLDIGPICRHFVAIYQGGATACHAEGRGFESHQRLSGKPAVAGFLALDRTLIDHVSRHFFGPVVDLGVADKDLVKSVGTRWDLAMLYTTTSFH